MRLKFSDRQLSLALSELAGGFPLCCSVGGNGALHSIVPRDERKRRLISHAAYDLHGCSNPQNQCGWGHEPHSDEFYKPEWFLTFLRTEPE